jgi:hypothetical protein
MTINCNFLRQYYIYKITLFMGNDEYMHGEKPKFFDSSIVNN